MDPIQSDSSDQALTIDGQCSTCRAPGAWCLTEATRSRMLVEPHPSERGNLRVAVDLFGDRIVTVVAAGSEPVLYLPHFARCPDANHHRKRTRA